jgi:hypothetical protein
LDVFTSLPASFLSWIEFQLQARIHYKEGSSLAKPVTGDSIPRNWADSSAVHDVENYNFSHKKMKTLLTVAVLVALRVAAFAGHEFIIEVGKTYVLKKDSVKALSYDSLDAAYAMADADNRSKTVMGMFQRGELVVCQRDEVVLVTGIGGKEGDIVQYHGASGETFYSYAPSFRELSRR